MAIERLPAHLLEPDTMRLVGSLARPVRMEMRPWVASASGIVGVVMQVEFERPDGTRFWCPAPDSDTLFTVEVGEGSDCIV